MIILGGSLYALEIPNYFKWIDKKASTTFKRTLLAIAYFNPLWIARHLFFLNLFSSGTESIGIYLFELGFYSFLTNIPISFLANHVIQNKISLQYRFTASAIFSSLMAIYYALAETLFT